MTCISITKQNNPALPAPDIILRSSDGKTFCTWKFILSSSSPVFNSMFLLQPTTPTQASDNTQGHQDGYLVIDLAEDSRTLKNILSFCYPPSFSGKHIKIESLLVRDLETVLEAVTKYKMENLRNAILRELANPLFLHEDPASVYALACRYECCETALLAAKHTLALTPHRYGGDPMTIYVFACRHKHREAALLGAKHMLALPTPDRYGDELQKLHDGKSLSGLLIYREECMTATLSLVGDHRWIVCHSRIAPLFKCHCGSPKQTKIRHPPSQKYPGGREEEMVGHRWWLDYMKDAGDELKVSPFPETVKNAKLVDKTMRRIKSGSICCSATEQQLLEAFQSFLNDFADEVERRISEVEIYLGF